MKKLLIIGFISMLTLMPVATNACPGKDKGGFGEKLGLTEEQKTQVKALRESFKEDMDAILTPEQREIAKTMREEHGGECMGKAQ